MDATMVHDEVNNNDSNWWEARMKAALEGRRQKGTLRKLHASAPATTPDTDTRPDDDLIDFSSNDYLGLAHDPDQHAAVESAYEQLVQADATRFVPRLGATGSRLLSGDSPTFHALERYIAGLHNRETAFLCNSGYDANLAVVSSLPADVILYDEYAHNSLHMGMRLWYAQDPEHKRMISFRHNSTEDLQQKLEQLTNNQNKHKADVIVLIESVYSMDGDVAPVRAMLDVAHQFGAQVIVDEAHGLGIYGRINNNYSNNNNNNNNGSRRITGGVPGGTGVLAAEQVERHPALACSIHTFGKAAGCHGAVVCGSTVFRDYLVNYGYPVIYSTALPLHSLAVIRCSYDTMTGSKGDRLRASVFELVCMFRRTLEPFLATCHRVHLLPSTSPIQALMIPDNTACTEFCNILFVKSNKRIQLFPIKSPTVPKGQERVRIILHSHNTTEQVETLVLLIQSTLRDMGIAVGPSRL
jgi:8-amino-7-oxononanoate synthase